jgi:acyl-CoA reductase-like NAD-dependent aldehyde dehydrogenase
VTISASEATVPVQHTDRFFIGDEWVTPSSDSVISVIDPSTEQVYLTVAEAQAPDIDLAVTAAKEAFDQGNVDNSSVIAQEEIFGPVLSVIPAADEADAVRIANDTIYGLHGAVFTNDVERAREVAGQMRTGAIGHNGFKSDFDMGHGGFKQSGIGREGGVEGLLPFLESKAMLLDGPTARYRANQV